MGLKRCRFIAFDGDEFEPLVFRYWALLGGGQPETCETPEEFAAALAAPADVLVVMTHRNRWQRSLQNWAEEPADVKRLAIRAVPELNCNALISFVCRQPRNDRAWPDSLAVLACNGIAYVHDILAIITALHDATDPGDLDSVLASADTLARGLGSPRGWYGPKTAESVDEASIPLGAVSG